MEVLSNLLSASSLQMQNYMLLWDYQDSGLLITACSQRAKTVMIATI